VLRYRPHGRESAETVYTIGEYGPFTVDQARNRAAELRVSVRDAQRDPQRDPHATKRANRDAQLAEKTAAKAAQAAKLAAPTVAALFDAYLEFAAADPERKASTLAFHRAYLGATTHKIGRRKGETVPSALRAALGHHKAAALTSDDVQAFYDMQRLTTPAAARRAVKELAAVYRFARQKKLVPADCDPAQISHLGKVSPSRRVALSSAQYAALGAALHTAETIGLPTAMSRKGRSGMSKERRAKLTGRTRVPKRSGSASAVVRDPNPVNVACVRFIAVTGWRKSEAQQLRWDMLDRERKIAVLDDTKTGESVRPLGETAWDLLTLEEARQRGAHGQRSPYVFPRRNDAARPVANLGPLWANVVESAGLTLTLHGMRHAFITVARELGFGDHVTAALVGHRLGSTQSGRYGLAPVSVVSEAADAVSAAILLRMNAALGETATPPADPIVLPFPARRASA
jgi:integrase